MEVLNPAKLQSVPDILVSEPIPFSFDLPLHMEGLMVVAILDPALKELLIREKLQWIKEHEPLRTLDPKG